MDKRGRDEVLAHLQTLDITDVEIKGDNGGRPTIRYMSLEAERELRERASKQPRRNRNHEFA
jgi:hypothetical protein